MRFAICNEIFGDRPLEDVAGLVADLGYDGIEISAATLADDVRTRDTAGRRRLREAVEGRGLRVAALHWLLIRPGGMHITSPDPRPRRDAVEHLRELARICDQLGGRILVFGSPAQRTFPPDTPREEAFARAVQVFRQVIPILDSRRVTLAFEPLPMQDTNFVTNAAEARALIETIRHPRFRLALDARAMVLGEEAPPEEVIRANADYLRHFHANDSTGTGPGMGRLDHAPLGEALRSAGYRGWVSVEAFDRRTDPETLARESLETLRRFYGGTTS